MTLLLGFRPDVQFAPFYVAQQEGYYADAGLEVTIEHRQAPDVQRLVADGQAEFGVADATDVMIARTAGHPDPLRLDAVPGASRSRSSAQAANRADDPADLAGHAIGTPGRFGSSWHALLALLEAGGLTDDDVTIREYPQFNQVDGLANGDVDLITGFRNNEPLQLEARGIEARPLTVDESRRCRGPGVIVGDELLADDPELVRAFVEATAAAQAAVIADPEVGLRRRGGRGARRSPRTPDVARAVLDATVELWEGDGFANGAIDEDLWATGYETMLRLGFIDGRCPLEEMIVTDLGGG